MDIKGKQACSTAEVTGIVCMCEPCVWWLQCVWSRLKHLRWLEGHLQSWLQTQNAKI